jgi:ankyrin repeat protein
MNKSMVIKYLLFSFFILVLFIACNKSPEKTREEARIKLGQMGVKYSEEEFLDRIKDNDVIAVKLFIAAGMDVNTNIGNGFTVLMYAAENGYLEIAKLLIENGADINAHEDEDIDAPIDNDTSGETALIKAVLENNLKMVKLLVENGADVNAKAYKEEAPVLLMAATGDNLEIVKFLIKNGADVNGTNRFGESILMLADFPGNEKTVKLLKEAGAKE